MPDPRPRALAPRVVRVLLLVLLVLLPDLAAPPLAAAPAQRSARAPGSDTTERAPAPSGAPEPPPDATAPAPELEEMVVTATRGQREVFDVPRSVIVKSGRDLRRSNDNVGLDALAEEVGIWVEKRNGASSDPVLRGFSGANVLALVDGDSLTTFWGEGGYAGDDMYAKVDVQSLERIEVVRGPASVLYGTNALGGVINFITRRPPIDYTSSGWEGGGELRTAFWGATDGVLLRGDVFGASPRFKYRLGHSIYDIGDTRGGGDLGLLEPSGVDQSNLDWSSELRLGPDDWLELNAQSTNTNGLPKYFRPNQRNFNDRTGATLRWRSHDNALGEATRLGLYFQDKEDERVWLDQDKYGVARWETAAADLQVFEPWGDDHYLTWGLQLAHETGESPDDEQFTITTPATGTQKAAPDSTWDNLGLYAQDEWRVGDGWSLTSSARLDYFAFEADDGVFWTNPGSTAAENVARTEPGEYDDTTVTGGIGVVRELDPDWMAYASWSRGYRLFPPNFGLRQSGFGVVAPTDGFLEPTTADQLELGTRVRRDGWSAGITAYYSFLRDVQQPVPGTWNGLSEIDLDGSGTVEPDERIYVVAGADGYVTGIEASASVDLGRWWSRAENWSWSNGVMLNRGRVDFEGGEEPLRHVHPPRWISALRWEDPDAARGRWMELVGDFVGRFDEVSDARLNSDPGYFEDPQDPSSGLLRDYGLPGYAVFHLRGVRLAEDVVLTAGVENLLDEEYRSAHSRMDAAGRNVSVALSVSF